MILVHGHVIDPSRQLDAAARAEAVFKRRLDACTRDAFRAAYGPRWYANAVVSVAMYPEEVARMVLGLWRARNGRA